MIDTTEQLTERQEALIDALLGTTSIAQAARLAGVADKTARRWADLPAFQAALEARRSPGQMRAETEKNREKQRMIDSQTAKNREKQRMIGEENRGKQSTEAQKSADPGEAAQQIVTKAATLRTEIDNQVRAAQETLAQLQSERAGVLAAQEQQAIALQQCEQQAIGAAHKAEQARAYASMADGTVGAQKALSDALLAQREAEQAQQRLQTARTGAAAQNQQTGERLTALDEMIARAQSIIAQAGPRLAEIAQVEHQALRELGESLHSAFLAELDQHDSTVTAARKSLTNAQMDRHSFLSRALAQMERWPDLAEDLKAAQPGVNDPTARILRAAIAFHDQLCADRRELRSGLMESAETSRMDNWWKLLLFDGLFAHQPFNTGADHQLLRHRRDQLARILADYERAHH